jgi:hypothetical protein
MKAELSLWNVAATMSGDHTLSQVFAIRGVGGDKQTVEAGWIKRSLTDSKLFVFYTPDNYTTSCYNTDCGFILQPGAPTVLNMSFSNYSEIDGDQYHAEFLLLKDGIMGDWWFRYQGHWIGRWPRSLFDTNGLESESNYVGSQGEVFQTASTTATDMGSGEHAAGGWLKAAFSRHLQYVDTTGTYGNSSFGNFATHSSCYSIAAWVDALPEWQQSFFYGGPFCSLAP